MPDYQLLPKRDLTVLIPARAGSKRCPGKNTRCLGGKPLIQWTIDAAKAADVCQIIVSTDDAVAQRIAEEAGCYIHHRKPQHATDEATDYAWVADLQHLITTPYYAILRPTSPFRTASTIRRGFAALVGSRAHAIRAVERVTYPHPAKMWTFSGTFMVPVMDGLHADGTPWHSIPTQSLPAVYQQNASLEMGQTWALLATRSISGYLIAPLLTDPVEGMDINTPEDFERAIELARSWPTP